MLLPPISHQLLHDFLCVLSQRPPLYAVVGSQLEAADQAAPVAEEDAARHKQLVSWGDIVPASDSAAVQHST
jgi:hypothetical protein